MILPLYLFRKNRLAKTVDEQRAVAAEISEHEALVLKFCTEVAKEVLPMFGEGRRITDEAVLERAALGYARPLALILKHVDLKGLPEREARAKSMLLEGTATLAMESSAFTPPALDLVLASSFILAYPGAIDLFEQLRDIYVRPSLKGDAARFANVVENMDMYWNDTQEGICRADTLRTLNGKPDRTPAETTYMKRLEGVGQEEIKEIKALKEKPNRTTAETMRLKRLEELAAPTPHYNNCAVKKWRLLVDSEGVRSQGWITLASYWSTAREAVKIPAIRAQQ